MTETRNWNYKYNDNTFWSSGLRNDKFFTKIHRKGDKTKRYWFELHLKKPIKSYFQSGNVLDVTNVYADSPAEAKEHCIKSIESFIQELEAFKEELQRLELDSNDS